MFQKDGPVINDAGDGEFEPTADMLVNDFDDERTLDEEEALEVDVDQEEEVDSLQKVSYIYLFKQLNYVENPFSYACKSKQSVK